MAAVTTFDGLLARISAAYDETFVFYGEATTARNSTVTSSTSYSMQRMAWTRAIPGSLPSGVSAYIPVEMCLNSTVTTQVLVAELINLGSLDISGASGTFTDGSAMPTRTELGASNQIPSPVMAEVTTVLSGTPGTYSITYVNQAGTSSRTSLANVPSSGALAGSAGFMNLSTTTVNDWGVTDITAAARASGTTPTGVIKFWGVIPIAFFPTVLNIAYVEDLINSGMIRRLGASAQLGIFAMQGQGNNTYAASGYVRFAGDS